MVVQCSCLCLGSWVAIAWLGCHHALRYLYQLPLHKHINCIELCPSSFHPIFLPISTLNPLPPPRSHPPASTLSPSPLPLTLTPLPPPSHPHPSLSPSHLPTPSSLHPPSHPHPSLSSSPLHPPPSTLSPSPLPLTLTLLPPPSHPHPSLSPSSIHPYCSVRYHSTSRLSSLTLRASTASATACTPEEHSAATASSATCPGTSSSTNSWITSTWT